MPVCGLLWISVVFESSSLSHWYIQMRFLQTAPRVYIADICELQDACISGIQRSSNELNVTWSPINVVYDNLSFNWSLLWKAAPNGDESCWEFKRTLVHSRRLSDVLTLHDSRWELKKQISSLDSRELLFCSGLLKTPIENNFLFYFGLSCCSSLCYVPSTDIFSIHSKLNSTCKKLWSCMVLHWFMPGIATIHVVKSRIRLTRMRIRREYSLPLLSTREIICLSHEQKFFDSHKNLRRKASPKKWARAAIISNALFQMKLHMFLIFFFYFLNPRKLTFHNRRTLWGHKSWWLTVIWMWLTTFYLPFSFPLNFIVVLQEK